MAFPWPRNPPRKPPSWYNKSQKEGTVSSSSPPPLGDLIQTLHVKDIEDSAKRYLHSAQIDNTQTVTSYSWVDSPGSGPTILIPGRPPLWTPEANRSPLKEDSGTYYRDKNAARYPKHPIEPAVVASLRADPSIPTKIDVFACGSTIGNLLRFVRGQDKSFRMLAYKVRNTVFLVRRENSPTELIPNVRGFGHAFPEANTTWEADVKGSASHQRLIRYAFGGLDMVVRFEADGYIPAAESPTLPQSTPTTTGTASSESSSADLATSLSTTTITPTSTPPTTPTLQIRPAGALIPQSTLFDLKTRSINTRLTRDHLAEELPRLWVSQIPTFILAFHNWGLFEQDNIEIKDVREDVRKWEEEHVQELALLAALLGWVRDVLDKEEVGGRAEIVCCGGGEGKLEVRRQLGDAGEVFSEGVRAEWEGMGAGGELVEGGAGDEQGIRDEEEDENGSGDEEGTGEVEWDDSEEGDFTACDEACGYCGKCTY